MKLIKSLNQPNCSQIKSKCGLFKVLKGLLCQYVNCDTINPLTPQERDLQSGRLDSCQ